MNLNLTPELVMMVSLTMGVTQIYKSMLPPVTNKKLFKVLKKITPFLAVFVAMILSFAYSKGFTYAALESGLLVGLTAAGVYSGGKTIINKNKTV
jgi:hypothetical protein